MLTAENLSWYKDDEVSQGLPTVKGQVDWSTPQGLKRLVRGCGGECILREVPSYPGWKEKTGRSGSTLQWVDRAAGYCSLTQQPSGLPVFSL